MKYDFTPHYELYKQQTGKDFPYEATVLLKRIAEQAQLFRNWGLWDKRSGFEPISREQVKTYCECYLTGPLKLCTGGAMGKVGEALTTALVAFYWEGYDSQSELISG